MNEPTKVTIRQLLVSEAKMLMGTIFGYTSGKIAIPNAELNIDYTLMHEQGKSEKEETIKELSERLTRMSPQSQLENMMKMSQSMNEIKKLQPISGWMMI